MPTQRIEEKRYCPTCQKKTIHWVTPLTTEPDSKEPKRPTEKTECRECGTTE